MERWVGRTFRRWTFEGWTLDLERLWLHVERWNIGRWDAGRQTLDIGRWMLDVGRWLAVIADMPSVQHNLFYPYVDYHISLPRRILHQPPSKDLHNWGKPCLTTEIGQPWLTSRPLKNYRDPQTQARPDDPRDGGSTARRAQQRSKNSNALVWSACRAWESRTRGMIGEQHKLKAARGWLKDPPTQARPKFAAPKMHAAHTW